MDHGSELQPIRIAIPFDMAVRPMGSQRSILRRA
jgi:hypothetical protein